MWSRGFRFPLTVVVIHHAVGALHALAHGALGVGLSVFQLAFISLVIYATPIASLVILWRRRFRLGGLLLTGSMVAALVFGVSNHFLLPGADNVSSPPPGPWGSGFQATAILLAALEILGARAGGRGLPRRDNDQPPAS